LPSDILFRATPAIVAKNGTGQTIGHSIVIPGGQDAIAAPGHAMSKTIEQVVQLEYRMMSIAFAGHIFGVSDVE
jgi:hypothetical protein